ncbi:hypothetical protein M5X00_17325 [Paenibacillus alvei]|nr:MULTISPECIES: hypothetical protein [Paenibacillus]MCY9544227.1 hypothetical protein [Paenibacillus alvei]MCY9706347.1 hypothetical protein [Paenibacillus alvei]MCY9732217.1 hypothetical protein [Paenibacillus alvei]MCY9756001.1 hypothetical protein [Paenibacillus alvei]MEC0078401.1 hypothetical protein [Paenibacillus alvei]
MSREKRLLVCINLLLLAIESESYRTRDVYLRQFRMVASRLKKKQLQAG